MDNYTVILLTIFVGLVALSQVAQAIALVAIQKRAKALQEQLQDQIKAFTPKAQSVLESAQLTLSTAQSTIEQSRKQIADITLKVNEIVETTRTQVNRVDALMTDFGGRAKNQLDRAEVVLDDTLDRVHETVSTVHSGVMRPIREINGISAGIRATLAHMMQGRKRPSVAQATQDEEMFI